MDDIIKQIVVKGFIDVDKNPEAKEDYKHLKRDVEEMYNALPKEYIEDRGVHEVKMELAFAFGMTIANHMCMMMDTKELLINAINEKIKREQNDK